MDRLAIGLSGLCLVHCLASAIVVAMLASAGGLLVSPAIHEIGLFIAILLGVDRARPRSDGGIELHDALRRGRPRPRRHGGRAHHAAFHGRDCLYDRRSADPRARPRSQPQGSDVRPLRRRARLVWRPASFYSDAMARNFPFGIGIRASPRGGNSGHEDRSARTSPAAAGAATLFPASRASAVPAPLSPLHKAMDRLGDRRTLDRVRLLSWQGEALVHDGGRQLRLGVSTMVVPFSWRPGRRAGRSLRAGRRPGRHDPRIRAAAGSSRGRDQRAPSRSPRPARAGAIRNLRDDASRPARQETRQSAAPPRPEGALDVLRV